MLRFYGLCRKKICVAEWLFLQGVLRFPPCFWMVQRGEFVVKRVVNVVQKTPLSRR